MGAIRVATQRNAETPSQIAANNKEFDSIAAVAGDLSRTISIAVKPTNMVAAGTQSPVVDRLNQNFTANVPQLFVDVDRNRVKTYGVPLQSVFNTLSANLGSAYVNDFNLFGRTWKVQVQADEQFRSRVSDIDRLEVRNAAGDMVPPATPRENLQAMVDVATKSLWRPQT